MVTDPHAGSPATAVDAFVGGYMGDSYRVRLDGDSLVHEHLGYGYQPQDRRTLRPSTDEWDEFWAVVDEVGVWAWEQRYTDDAVTDGTSWSIRLAHGAHRVESRGSNAAPAGLRQLCEAISRLAGAPFR